MTSRERVLNALARRTPDRVPVDLGGTESSSLTGIAWRRLMAYLGMDVDAGPRILDPYQGVSAMNDALVSRFGIDTAALMIEPRGWAPGKLGEGSACQMPVLWRERTAADGSRQALSPSGQVFAQLPVGGLYFDPVGAPLAGCESPADVTRYASIIEGCDLPFYCDEPVESTAARARELHDGTDRAVVFNLCCHLLHAGTALRGYETFLCDLLDDSGLAAAILDHLVDVYLRRIDRYASALRGHVDVILFNDDLGTQRGPMISPETYRAIIKPRQARLFAYAKKTFGVPILFHSCGAVSEFIPDLIEVGVDALNPVQISAAGMDPVRLKREYGRDICFWGGGCDSQRVLARGTTDDVRREVRCRIGQLAEGGGFVFTQVHNIQPDVPPENVVAMLEATKEFGR